MTKQRGIIMSAPMVRANLAKIKTETRRLNELRGINANLDANWELEKTDTGYFFRTPLVAIAPVFIKCPYGQPGDILYQRENLYCGEGNLWRYKADNAMVMCDQQDGAKMVSWTFHKELNYCPSIHMPKFAARCWFEIVDWRIERLQDIAEESAIAEGIEHWPSPLHPGRTEYRDYWVKGAPDHLEDIGLVNPATSYMSLWVSINGAPSWLRNPFVWVVKYKHIDKPKGGES